MKGKLLPILYEYISLLSYQMPDVSEKTIILPVVWFENLKKECYNEFRSFIGRETLKLGITNFSIQLGGVKLSFYRQGFKTNGSHDTDSFFEFLYDNYLKETTHE